MFNVRLYLGTEDEGESEEEAAVETKAVELWLEVLSLEKVLGHEIGPTEYFAWQQYNKEVTLGISYFCV